MFLSSDFLVLLLVRNWLKTRQWIHQGIFVGMHEKHYGLPEKDFLHCFRVYFASWKCFYLSPGQSRFPASLRARRKKLRQEKKFRGRKKKFQAGEKGFFTSRLAAWSYSGLRGRVFSWDVCRLSIFKNLTTLRFYDFFLDILKKNLWTSDFFDFLGYSVQILINFFLKNFEGDKRPRNTKLNPLYDHAARRLVKTELKTGIGLIYSMTSSVSRIPPHLTA